MPEIPPGTPPQPTAPELAAWLTENGSALTVEPEPDGTALRVRFADRPGFTDHVSRRLALTDARARMESAACPWTLAADTLTEDDQPSPGGADLSTLLVRSITPQESAARREARTLARQRKRTATREANAAANAAHEAARLERLAAATPVPQAEPLSADHPVRSIDPGELPVLGYAHGPDHYQGHTEPGRFRRLGPDPVVRGAHPQRGAGLWTSPAIEQDDDGTVLETVWPQWWDREYPGDDRYSEHLRIVPEPTARIVLIDSHQDLIALVCRYPNPPEASPWDDSHLFPDWPRVAADWDAVYLTEDGARATAAEDPAEATAPHLDGWDRAAVLWLNPTYSVADGLGL